MEYLNSFAIDSCKIRIPLYMVKVLDNRLLDDYVCVHRENLIDHGSIEIDEDHFKAKAIAVNDNGIKTKFLIQKFFINGETDVQQEYLVILLNSKVLKENYLKGITKDTIEQAHEYLMSLKIVKFQLFTMMYNAKLSDIDIKCDFECKYYDEFYKRIISDCDKNKRSAFSNKGYRYFNKKENRGIEFGDRRKATLNAPFFKIYHKRTELVYNSHEFGNAYLEDHLQKTYFNFVLRAEFTLKNAKFIKHFLGTTSELENILNLDQLKFKQAIQKIKALHITPRDKLKTISAILPPMEQMLLNALLVWDSIESEVHFAEVQKIILNGLDGNAKSRCKKKLENLYFNYVVKADKCDLLSVQEHIQSGLEAIGYIL